MKTHEIRKILNELYRKADDNLHAMKDSRHHPLEEDSYNYGYVVGVREMCMHLLGIIK